jgi:single-strand DNA-binding protein
VDEQGSLNEVRLRGRWQGAEQRELPSGDVVVTSRVVVPRPEGGVDAVDCAVWPAALRRRVLGWPEGVEVEVTGTLRRRFWRTPGGPASRYEVHVQRITRQRPVRVSA